MKGSLFGLLSVILLALFLIIRSSRKSTENRYEPKSKNNWNELTQGNDPTDE